MRLKLTMSGVEKYSTPIKAHKDLTRIRHAAEREFARFLLNKNPHLTIIYEPKGFFYTDDTGIQRGTIPDFLIINPKNSGKNIYVELTLAQKTKTVKDKSGNEIVEISDFKERQKKVMEKCAPNERYIVLYKEQIKNIMRKNPDFNPWSPKKIQPEDKKDLVHTI